MVSAGHTIGAACNVSGSLIGSHGDVTPRGSGVCKNEINRLFSQEKVAVHPE
jgi:hypothetical protein